MAGRFVYNLIHFVWSTHDRREWIAESWEDGLYAYIGGIARNKQATLLQAGGMPDHVHALVSLPPLLSITKLITAVDGLIDGQLFQFARLNSKPVIL